jgi:hypothetical protein
MRVGSRVRRALLVCVSTVVALGVVSAAPARAIVGGVEADPADHPYFVKVSGTTFPCGGSVIDHSWVLTAAHCVDNDVNSPSSVQVAHPRASGTVGWPSWNATRVIVHPLWDHQRRLAGHDLALIELPPGSLAGIPTVQVGAAWDPSAYAPGRPVTIMGYGQTSGEGPPSFRLMVAGTTIRSDGYMDDIWSDWTAPLLIGAGLAGQTTCRGDSGGPLMAGDVQVGIVSFGTEHCDRAAGFTELTGAQLAWIASHVAPVADRWGPCTSEFGTPGDNHATYGPVASPGSAPDGPFHWRIWCWVPTTSVPDVRGLTRAGAAGALQAVGLQLGAVTGLVDPTCNDIGLVVGQSPARGSVVPPGTAVSVRIGTRPRTACP